MPQGPPTRPTIFPLPNDRSFLGDAVGPVNTHAGLPQTAWGRTRTARPDDRQPTTAAPRFGLAESPSASFGPRGCAPRQPGEIERRHAGGLTGTRKPCPAVRPMGAGFAAWLKGRPWSQPAHKQPRKRPPPPWPSMAPINPLRRRAPGRRLLIQKITISSGPRSQHDFESPG